MRCLFFPLCSGVSAKQNASTRRNRASNCYKVNAEMAARSTCARVKRKHFTAQAGQPPKGRGDTALPLGKMRSQGKYGKCLCLDST